MDAAVKVSVVTIVRDGGAKQLGRWGKKYEEHVTVQSVIDAAAMNRGGELLRHGPGATAKPSLACANCPASL